MRRAADARVEREGVEAPLDAASLGVLAPDVEGPQHETGLREAGVVDVADRLVAVDRPHAVPARVVAADVAEERIQPVAAADVLLLGAEIRGEKDHPHALVAELVLEVGVHGHQRRAAPALAVPVVEVDGQGTEVLAGECLPVGRRGGAVVNEPADAARRLLLGAPARDDERVEHAHLVVVPDARLADREQGSHDDGAVRGVAAVLEERAEHLDAARARLRIRLVVEERPELQLARGAFTGPLFPCLHEGWQCFGA